MFDRLARRDRGRQQSRKLDRVSIRRFAAQKQTVVAQDTPVRSEQRRQAQDEPIERGPIRGAPPGPIDAPNVTTGSILLTSIVSL